MNKELLQRYSAILSLLDQHTEKIEEKAKPLKRAFYSAQRRLWSLSWATTAHPPDEVIDTGVDPFFDTLSWRWSGDHPPFPPLSAYHEWQQASLDYAPYRNCLRQLRALRKDIVRARNHAETIAKQKAKKQPIPSLFESAEELPSWPDLSLYVPTTDSDGGDYDAA